MRRLGRWLRTFALFALLGFTWAVDIYHVGVFPRPPLPADPAPATALWYPKSDPRSGGINQLVLAGGPYARGLAEGRITRELLQAQERSLMARLPGVLRSPWGMRAFSVVLIRWFWGIEKYFAPWMVEEMYGISQSAPAEFDFLADPLTRQVAYHGLHEVGQMMVDQGSDDMGCTVVALPRQGRWIIGRNFDFEAGRIFDSEKIVKWVYPDQGYPFVSVIWAGMVGAVTGVNQNGVYISLNAAGSADFRRYGTPSSLVLRQALQFARTADEAAEIIRHAPMFITDIFVVSDRSGNLLRIEKSPRATEILPLTGPSVVTNHLISPRWHSDSVNQYRRRELTTEARAARGEWLVGQLAAAVPPPDSRSPDRAVSGVLRILRDKGSAAGVGEGPPLPLGNRRAIDPLIAVHAVIYDEIQNRLYVSQGPAVSGPLTGFDLTASFAARAPVVAGARPRDPIVSDRAFEELSENRRLTSDARRLLSRGDCEAAAPLFSGESGRLTETSGFDTVFGDFLAKCQRDPGSAKKAWQAAISLVPAYPRELRELQRRLNP